jgi:O-antigen/teichoic acid export membrane protein
MMSFSIILTPIWSAFTDAWVKKDLSWIKKTILNLQKFWYITCLLGLIMIIFSKHVFRFWIGNAIEIPFHISIYVCLWVLLNAYNSIYSHFFNGISRIGLQMRIAIISSLINIPLALYLGKNFGLSGILISNLLIALICTVFYPIHYRKIISETAKGIWSK